VITSNPAVTDNSDGRLEVFARGTDDALWHIWQTAAHSGPWSGWASLGGILKDEHVVGKPHETSPNSGPSNRTDLTKDESLRRAA
jgi:hypothetical protein